MCEQCENCDYLACNISYEGDNCIKHEINSSVELQNARYLELPSESFIFCTVKCCKYNRI